MIDKAREIALKTLYKIDKEQAYSNIVLNDEIKQNRNKINDKDIGLISEIVYGVTTWKLTIDEIIKKYSKIRLKKISPWILNILRMGTYQIIFLDKIPKSAAVNESVNLAKRYGHASSSNFTNAILRKIEKEDYEEFFQIKDDVERISKTTSMPVWIIEELMKNNTIEEVEEICKNLNLRPEIIIRINKLKTTKEEIMRKLEEANIEYREIPDMEDFLVLNKIKNIENSSLFKEGLFTVQDASAGLTAIVLNPQEDENVLDACSAPGGKTTYIAELMHNKGKIEAWDIHEHRTKLVEKNAERLGIKIINTDVKNSAEYEEKYKEKFDRILLDVPCMGIGVIKRKPDIKWQRKILETCSKYLKRGGYLVYSTCSILKGENEDIVNDFIKNNSDFEIVKNGLFNIKPDKEKDGFLICKLHKK